MTATKRYRRLELGSYAIPGEVLEIEEDIVRLSFIQHILRQIDGRNCNLDFQKGHRDLARLRKAVHECKRAAELKRREFLYKQ